MAEVDLASDSDGGETLVEGSKHSQLGHNDTTNIIRMSSLFLGQKAFSSYRNHVQFLKKIKKKLEPEICHCDNDFLQLT